MLLPVSADMLNKTKSDQVGEIDVTATSAKNPEVKYEYKLLEAEVDNWTPGLPEGYVIRVYADDNDTDKILGDKRYFWIGNESQPDDEGILTLEKDKEYNLGVEIKNPNATKHVYYARVIAQQGGNSKIEKIDALSQEAGTYFVSVFCE